MLTREGFNRIPGVEGSLIMRQRLYRRVDSDGLLHNLDFDRVKEADRHCLVTAEVLGKEGVHPAGIHAIAAHNDKGLAATGIRCISHMDHAVSCAEAVVGLIHACAQVMPSKDVGELKLKSVVKRFKNKKFAANVERDLIERCAGLDIELPDFLALALSALQEERSCEASTSA